MTLSLTATTFMLFLNAVAGVHYRSMKNSLRSRQAGSFPAPIFSGGPARAGPHSHMQADVFCSSRDAFSLLLRMQFFDFRLSNRFCHSVIQAVQTVFCAITCLNRLNRF